MKESGSWDYRRALEELWRRSSYERGLISDPFGDAERAERGLARMRALLSSLGDPHDRVPAVHLAGSNGKGSTGAFIAAAAIEAGLRSGFYTSPHLHRFPERIAVDGRPLEDDEFAANAELVADAARRLDAASPAADAVSTFELVTAMSFAAFAQRACDLAVIEVGLGGRYDSTNVLQPVATVITRIDLEHTAVLGSTFAEIAVQKAGIMQPGVVCLSSPQVPEAEAAIALAATRRGSPLLAGGRDWTWTGSWSSFRVSGPWGDWGDLTLGIIGPHQVENACTALAALHEVNAAGIAIPEAAIHRGLEHARWPARFERLTRGGREFVFDAAHTPAAAAALVATWRELHLPLPATVILGMGADKHPREFLATLRPLIGRLIVTRADSPRAADPEIILRDAESLGIPGEVEPSVAAAVAAAAAAPGPLLITGSLFVAGEGREAFGLAKPDPVWRALNEENRAAGDTTSPARDGITIANSAPAIQ